MVGRFTRGLLLRAGSTELRLKSATAAAAAAAEEEAPPLGSGVALPSGVGAEAIMLARTDSSSTQ